METFYNRKNNYWKNLKILWHKRNCSLWFLLLPQCFHNSSAAEASEIASVCQKGFKFHNEVSLLLMASKYLSDIINNGNHTYK